MLDVVAAVGDTGDRDSFAQVALRELSVLVRSGISSLNEVDPAADRLVFLSEPADVAYQPDAPAVFARLAPTHPLIKHYNDTGDGSAVKISDFWSGEQWHASELFTDFYRPLDVEHQMSITLPAPAPIIVAIAVNRTGPEDDFDERDRAVLNAVRPHLAQAWRRAREHERVTMLLAAASSALAATGTLVILLSSQPHELTPGALTALYRFFGRPARDDALPPRVRRWLDGQRVHGGGLDLGRPLHAARDGRRLIVRHLPGLHGDPDALLLDERAALTSLTTLREAGLTDREAQVLAQLGTGATTAAIAAELSLSPWTVKRHLANIYAKLGVSGRVAATAVALEMTGHHGRPE